jgi:hypothetical protein
MRKQDSRHHCRPRFATTPGLAIMGAEYSILDFRFLILGGRRDPKSKIINPKSNRSAV